MGADLEPLEQHALVLRNTRTPRPPYVAQVGKQPQFALSAAHQDALSLEYRHADALQVQSRTHGMYTLGLVTRTRQRIV